VTCDTVQPVHAGPGPLSEPLELLASLRDLARRQPERARESAPQLLADYASRSWAAPSWTGWDLTAVEAAFAAARREIWLWVKGNRVWDQLEVALVGRVARRLER
jgi:hypothetical protein